MIKLNTKTPLIDLDGQIITIDGKKDSAPQTIGFIISESLALVKNNDPVRAWEFAQKFRKEEIVEVDTMTLAMIKESVKGSSFMPFITGQVLAFIENSKEEKEDAVQ